jgi:ribosome-binding protein aMBF1 (putative translation factor)
MREEKKKRLKKKGWQVGDADEFLKLTEEESEFVELKLKLSEAFRNRRRKRGMTQVEVARAIRSSQSRVAKIEAGDPSVSVDLLIRALFAMGTTSRELGRVVGSGQRSAAK